jgi:hypothetical protein
MPEERSFEDVIEAHRLKISASKVRVSIGSDATPDGLAAELEKLRLKIAAYASFTELEREQAKVHRLRAVLSRISALTTTPFDGVSMEETQKRMSEIFGLSDMPPDIDLEEDIAWMTAQREKRGEALPPAPV